MVTSILSSSLPIALSILLAISVASLPAAEDVLLADFEGEDYGAWKSTGEAFGPGPARGTLPNQMPVSGFLGKGLVNSYFKGDGTTGTLTSPEFRIERRFLSFLIGGGGHKDKTCLNLLIGGKVVRTMTGPNTAPGGSEELEPKFWDLADLAGKMAVLQIVDEATGGWGHINVDHIVATDKRPEVDPALLRRELVLRERYLLLPVKTGARKARATLEVDGAVVREFEIELSDEPDWFAHLDVGAWRGKTALFRIDRLSAGSKALEAVTQSNDIWLSEKIYAEPLRPQVHFSPRRGWTNDPNGMVYSNGEYHLYFQHNPYGWNWGNMHWGHAVSRDLVYWEELPIALYPPKFGDWAFSGSAVVDKANTSGRKMGDAELLVAAFTSTGRGECIAFSSDGGRNWAEYEKNPVVKHTGRDPRLLWHEPSKRWVMVLYTEAEGKRWLAFYNSPDLKTWTYQSRIEGFYECPDLFELPVDGDAANRKWVLTAADSHYMVGTFDGATFKPNMLKLTGMRGKGFYASQTFINDPKGRVIQIGWLQAPSPGMAFNQCMSLPLELGLISTSAGPRLTWTPAAELRKLREKTHSFEPCELNATSDPLVTPKGEILEVEVDFEPRESAELELTVRGVPIVYNAKRQELTVNGHPASAPLANGKQSLRIFADRTVFEVFASGGKAYIPLPVIPKADQFGVSLGVRGDSVKVSRYEVHELGSIWKR